MFVQQVYLFDSEHCDSVQLHTAFIKKVCCCVECCMLEFICCFLHVDFTVVLVFSFLTLLHNCCGGGVSCI